jgi:hypothetical protein
MTENQKLEYLKCGGVNCPFCKSTDLHCASPETDGSSTSVDVECMECGTTWVDIYTLSDVVSEE